jgi:hypothetical protein
MWLVLTTKRRLRKLLRDQFEQGFRLGFTQGELHALKEILKWRAVMLSEPMGIMAQQIEEILKQKGLL